jgi:hypothetical protein
LTVLVAALGLVLFSLLGCSSAQAADVTFDCGYWGGTAVLSTSGAEVVVGTLNGKPWSVFPAAPITLQNCLGEYVFSSSSSDVVASVVESEFTKRFWMAGAGLLSALVFGGALLLGFRA